MDSTEQTTQNKGTELKKILKSRNFKIFLFILVLGLSIFGFSAAKNTDPEIETGLVLPTPTLSYIERQQTKLQVINNELPYQSDKFNIEYFSKDDTFWVKIKQNPFEENQKLVLQWFRDKGINPEDVQIEWTSVRGVGP